MTYTPTVIKSLQRNTLTIPAGSTGATVAVTTVDPNYASLRNLGATIASGDSASSLGGIYMSSPSAITGFRVGTTGNLVIGWELVEFLPSAVSRVQRANTSTATVTSATAAISPVNMARSAIHHNGNSTTDASSGNFSNDLTRVEITSASVVTVFVGTATFSQVTAWEIVEFK